MDLERVGISLRSILPTRARAGLKSTIRRVQAWTHAGDRVTCPICDGHFRSFLARNGMPNVQCPRCWSLVRHRSLWLYLRDQRHVGERPTRLLHFAPEPGIERRLRSLPGIDYVSGDIDDALADERVDIVKMQFPDESFDLVICSHVLEHVPDDRAAIGELYRILRPGGTVIIIVPVKVDVTEEYLDPSPTPAHPDGYLRLGSHGHVRNIGSDYPERLRAGGFEVDVFDYAASVDDATRTRYALTPGQPFFLCSRAA